MRLLYITNALNSSAYMINMCATCYSFFMRYLFASDIHGSYESFKILIKKFKQLSCDKMILLGDYLGGNNIDNEDIIESMNFFKNDLIALEGNCDRYIFNTFDFELRDSFTFRQNDRIYCLNHGDNLNQYIDNFINIDNVFIVYGHTHRVSSYTNGGITFINIGSISSPRGNSKKCYGIIDENSISIFDLDDNKILSI